MGLIFETNVRNDPLDVRRALIAFRHAMQGQDQERLTGTSEIVLAEVLNNIVEHALAGRGVSGTIHLECRTLGAALSFEVVDNGIPLPGGTCPTRSMPQLGKFEELPEGGFGWALVRILASELDYQRENGRNHLKFRIAPTV